MTWQGAEGGEMEGLKMTERKRDGRRDGNDGGIVQ